MVAVAYKCPRVENRHFQSLENNPFTVGEKDPRPYYKKGPSARGSKNDLGPDFRVGENLKLPAPNSPFHGPWLGNWNPVFRNNWKADARPAKSVLS